MGDVLVDRPDPVAALSGVRGVLAGADVAFGNFEGVLTDTHPVIPGASSASVVGAGNAAGLGGLRVMSLANNHSMDAGAAGLRDTMRVLAASGIQTCGAGPDLATALAPAVLTAGGLRVAFVAVTAVLQHGAQARRGVAGVAPLTAEDAYLAPYPGMCTPGVPPRVVSILDEPCWEAVAGALAAARQDADLLVVSAHWGDHTRPWVLTDHERLCAELLTDAGADLVLGHHQHMLRGTDLVAGRPIFYGLGHIVFDYPRFTAELADRGLDVSALSAGELSDLFGEYGIYPRPEHPAFPFHPLARRTGVAVIELTASGVGRCGLVPCLIGMDGVARPVAREDAGWADALAFLGECQRRAGLDVSVADRGAEFAGHPLVEYVSP